MGLYDTTTGASGWIVRKYSDGTTNFYGTATNATNDGDGNKISTTYLKSVSINSTGTGNAITTISANGGTITADKGITFLTGSSTNNNCLAKFNGTNTLTTGPAIGTGTTKFLREDGTWVVPSYTTNTDENVK